MTHTVFLSRIHVAAGVSPSVLDAAKEQGFDGPSSEVWGRKFTVIHGHACMYISLIQYGVAWLKVAYKCRLKIKAGISFLDVGSPARHPLLLDQSSPQHFYDSPMIGH